MKENGFRSTRRTKLICTIGPASCKPEQLEALAVGGMNVARINMCHGTREWHREVIQRVRRWIEKKGYAVAIMMDTEGSEIHMGDVVRLPQKLREFCRMVRKILIVTKEEVQQMNPGTLISKGEETSSVAEGTDAKEMKNIPTTSS